jgi:pimeloyl-ACP methyl ester carboxylesterase
MVDRQDADATGNSTLPLDGGNIYVRQDGPHDAPALVLIHGTGASTRWWDRVVPALAKSYHVIRIDLLGHGRSAKPAGGGYAIPQQARRVGQALDGSASPTPSWSATPPAARSPPPWPSNAATW